MNLQFIVVVVTTFLVINTYNDGKYIELIKSWKKYYIMGGYILIGLSVIYYIKKNPEDGLKLVSSGSGLLQSIPIDKSSKDIITPFLNKTLPTPTPLHVYEKEGVQPIKTTKPSKQQNITTDNKHKVNFLIMSGEISKRNLTDKTKNKYLK